MHVRLFVHQDHQRVRARFASCDGRPTIDLRRALAEIEDGWRG